MEVNVQEIRRPIAMQPFRSLTFPAVRYFRVKIFSQLVFRLGVLSKTNGSTPRD